MAQRPKPKELPPVETIRELFNYNPMSGILTWRERPRSHFTSDGAWKTWNKRYAGKPVGGSNSSGYLQAQMTLDSKLFRPLVHVIAWAIQTGKWPDDSVDHINHQGDDNRWENLRAVTHAENTRNRTPHKNNTSGVTGVHLHGKKWRAQIRDDQGVLRDLGGFDSLEHATRRRAAAEIALGYHPNHGIDLANGGAPGFAKGITICTDHDGETGRLVQDRLMGEED
ncbi:HNH endonuclease signature motif containing protein [Kaistia terrae]|uniref:HNH endonuclease signature motif containing protein n=1 Tax=Kaistia terrae TaxID=537017 RepID=A0ABW0PSX4_9HYPH|nr:HNH endonuclease signature motif containing protein [Kaistia terrae]MCX5577241.1 HNH endonuclease signature motif containing protein [Kaistia terrae]